MIDPITLTELLEADYPPITWIVPDMLPAGLTLFVGGPKTGKSWMCLGLCKAVAFGLPSINGKTPEQAGALYMALEDTHRRLQDRYKKMTDEVKQSSLFFFETESARADEGGLDHLEAWLDANPEVKLVIIDTLQKFRSRGGSYSKDYQELGRLKKIADDRKIALILVHHTRKAKAQDPFDMISGSSALMGAADTIWVLQRPRDQKQSRLSVTGRDVSGGDYLAELDLESFEWRILGEYGQELELSQPDEVADLALELNKPITPQDVANALGITINAAKVKLHRSTKAGRLHRIKRGQYIHFSKTPKTDNSKPVSIADYLKKHNIAQ